MRLKPMLSLGLSVALFSILGQVSAGWAWGRHDHARLALQNEQSGTKPLEAQTQKSNAKTQKGNLIVAVNNPTQLAAMHSFGVLDMEPYDFSAAREPIPAEVQEYARTAIQNDGRLQYQSLAAEGVLRFRCVNSSCSIIRAEVTQGSDGPVVWATEAVYQPSIWVNVHFLPDSQKFARQIVDKLASDYQQALTPSSVKINIEE